MTKIVVLNVGANKKNPGVRGPIYENGSFKFIPILENPDYHGPTYRKLNLEQYVPVEILDKVAHPDPDFVSFTYGHIKRVGEMNKLTQLQPGDYLFFLATLDYKGPQAKRPKWINPNWGAYLIGYFRIQHIIQRNKFIEQPEEIKQMFTKNAHYEKGEFLADLAIKGDTNSALLQTAVPLSNPTTSHLPNKISKTVFLAEWIANNPGKEPRGWYRWPLTCHDKRKITTLWNEINKFNPNQSTKTTNP